MDEYVEFPKQTQPVDILDDHFEFNSDLEELCQKETEDTSLTNSSGHTIDLDTSYVSVV